MNSNPLTLFCSTRLQETQPSTATSNTSYVNAVCFVKSRPAEERRLDPAPCSLVRWKPGNMRRQITVSDHSPTVLYIQPLSKSNLIFISIQILSSSIPLHIPASPAETMTFHGGKKMNTKLDPVSPSFARHASWKITFGINSQSPMFSALGAAGDVKTISRQV